MTKREQIRAAYIKGAMDSLNGMDLSTAMRRGREDKAYETGAEAGRVLKRAADKFAVTMVVANANNKHMEEVTLGDVVAYEDGQL